jgi:hypothetical protein
MKLKTRLLILAGNLGLLILLPSCQSTGNSTVGGTHNMGGPKPSWSMANADMAGAGRNEAGTDAIMCDKCKTVWVRKPAAVGSPGRIQTVILRDSKSMTCPECTQAVSGLGKSWSAKHVCSSCGGTLTHCTQH